MSNDNKSIHEHEIKLICDYFSSMERQGPGSIEATLTALRFIDKLTQGSRIADIGCGTGGQTMVLAQNAPGKITGIDLFPSFIDIFNANAKRLNLDDRVKGITGSMDDLPFSEEEFDLLWSEGAIYNIGFERGLSEWRKFLKRGGYVAVTDASWFTPQRPAEIHEFWTEAYPGIDTIPNNMAKLQNAGYTPVASFILPEICWTDYFYVPQAKAQEVFLAKYPGNQAALDLVEYQRHESRLYDKYSAFYGYVFYVGRKV